MGKPPPLTVRLEEALPFQRLIGEANRGFSHHGPAKAMRRRNHIKREWQNRSHVRWYCRYPIVIVPKYRQKAIFGTLRQDIGKILRELCDQMGIELIAG
jgi:hypothetical protein